MTAILELQNVGYRAQENQILQGISLSVGAEDYLTITGPSGGGKSTLLRVLASLLTATEGKILFKGQDISEKDPIEYRRQVSYCFQQPTLFGRTVADNLDFPFQIRNADIDVAKQKSALEYVGLPESYLSKKITELSGGEKQRVAMIRNIMFSPDVLLLDEVTAGLDEANKDIVHNLIEHFHKDHHVTILAVTHDATEIAQASHIITIVKGKLEVTK
ncbi:YbbL ABC transporter ATP-binding protein [Pediococcus damnosus]|uniref:YbbL ABC transporter ATP-binding protein n=1 Tax=Pediococcus damnosus TaxID=51663 RepID=A0A0R2HHS1_9LACO|nr:ATP-binding cassette domain-containing protein [Pediococcus damnosus]AMV60647.1 YbbL ABC transporter ATP-binding protein [Pediococcus damnosus]AMV62895.1 YbbL ABC transporter ATP-binding protein [Pediococcus damnosus]AMV64962.1 YbbL ABC transporter ATP-binding protein [Pediococcus damnosus]AMV67221.1 YbbL ABC transporter ATP-binding protein [Pediococcus damnosus]AMV69767.1 YbbL ABC transporter ATP-binding protein [Pediococcus damnosus]